MVEKPHPESLATGALLTALVSLGPLSTSIYIPSMPAIGQAFSADAGQVTLTLSFFLLGFAGAQLAYGPLSDRFGRRPALMVGIGLYILAGLWAALASGIEALTAARFLQGVGACSGQVLGRAVVRDIYGPDRQARVLAYIGLALAITPALAPIIGGYVQVWLGWRANFFLLAGAGALMGLAVWARLPETSPNTGRDGAGKGGVGTMAGTMAGTYGALLRRADYLAYILAIAFVFSGLMAFTAVGPFLFIENLGLSPDHFGLLSLFNVGGFMVGSLIAGKISHRYGHGRMVRAGIILVLIGGGGMTGFAMAGQFSVAVIIGPMMVFLSGMGIVMPNAMAGALAPFPKAAGAASAMLGFVQMSVASVFAQAAGWLPRGDQLPLAITILCLGVAAWAAAVFLLPSAMEE